jgi:hypothetical protein
MLVMLKKQEMQTIFLEICHFNKILNYHILFHHTIKNSMIITVPVIYRNYHYDNQVISMTTKDVLPNFFDKLITLPTLVNCWSINVQSSPSKHVHIIQHHYYSDIFQTMFYKLCHLTSSVYHLRVIGIVHGTKQDYYVIEMISSDQASSDYTDHGNVYDIDWYLTNQPSEYNQNLADSLMIKLINDSPYSSADVFITTYLSQIRYRFIYPAIMRMYSENKFAYQDYLQIYGGVWLPIYYIHKDNYDRIMKVLVSLKDS